MSNDAKLGLIVGVGLVIAVAVVFSRKEAATAKSPTEETTAVAPVSRMPTAESIARTTSRPVPAKEAIPSGESTEDRRHTVQEGETLFSLAQRYYGDGDRFTEIYRANREILKTPDKLEPGSVLVIPVLPETVATPTENGDSVR